ncbi:DUF3667 domain-containing protein [Puia dinghuensis]|uniref:DUF3667 domain-containing protein n=1 Tax=Puia dinghuensis TaxID=1792502 RepID=A0A8J2UIT6_9BACT|nr:DUF3667 domain-containing protein [Puia dinghuensis]GGB22094.1 hypothetical protein GCM10011511_52440 [Puia dinghuensis]
MPRRHHLRHDKTCLNCGATVEERFCTRCGQENIEPTETVGHLVGHFFADITHFDSKLFITVKDLILRPGFLTREYVAGRRASYLNPIRMYIFISAMFFLAVFAGREGTDKPHDDPPQKVKPGEETLNITMRSFGMVIFDLEEYKYRNIHEYDSIQQNLPDTAKAKDKGIERWMMRHNLGVKEAHNGNGKIHLEIDIHHDIPKLMFILLPLFALYVGWFYSRKKYYYVNHAIFSVHYHSFVFLMLLVFLLLGRLIPGEWSGLLLGVISMLGAFGYLVASLRGMYGQSFWVSLGKGLAIGFIYWVTLIIAMSVLMVLTYVSL